MELRSGKVCTLLQLHHLPIEVIDIILEHSHVNDMLNWRQTSKYWFNIVSRSSEFKNRVQLKITNNNCDDVMNCTRDYINIRICHDASFGEEKFKPVLEEFAPKIQRLNISADDMVQIHFPKLLELSISGTILGDLPENVKYLLTVHASQIEALQLCCVGIESVNQAMRMLPNLRVLDVFTLQLVPYHSIQPVDAVNESILALKMWLNIDCFSSMRNLRKLGVAFLDFSIVRKCFQHLLKLEVVEYCCIEHSEQIDMERFKRELISSYNFNFDKENKRNVKFVQKEFGAEFKFGKYDLSLRHDILIASNT